MCFRAQRFSSSASVRSNREPSDCWKGRGESVLCQAITPAGGFEAGAIERAMPAAQRPEQPVEPEKAYAEVGVHAALYVDRVMVNVVESPRCDEPRTQQWMTDHPEIGLVHTVVEVAEHEDRPADQRRECHGLIYLRNMQQKQDGPDDGQQDGGGNQPFETDIAEREAAVGRVVVTIVAHRLAGAVDEKVVDQVATAEEDDFVAVQQAMQTVSQEFGEQAGEHQGNRGCGEFRKEDSVRHDAPFDRGTLKERAADRSAPFVPSESKAPCGLPSETRCGARQRDPAPGVQSRVSVNRK
jgi:hypothetical protein